MILSLQVDLHKLFCTSMLADLHLCFPIMNRAFYLAVWLQNTHLIHFDSHFNFIIFQLPLQVKYLQGQAVIQDELEVQILTDVSPIKMVLLTKWPTIELKWTDNTIPSLN